MMSRGALNITEFGPCRVIGVSYTGKNQNNEIPQLWHQQLMPRAGEIRKPPQGAAFGVCRCIPGATDGTFEYIAAFEATADAPVPAGMVELQIPRCHYAIYEVASLAEIGPAWQRIQVAHGNQTEWQPYCGPKGCQCATHPNFEYYPVTFPKDGRLWLYVPMKRA